jgi:RNA recognition motif-containing protein
MSSENLPKTIFIGGISRKVQQEDLTDAFKRYGKILNVKMKGEYAFIEFDDVGDADAAVKEMTNNRICGHKITVQKSYGGRKERNKGPGGTDVCFNCGDKGHW